MLRGETGEELCFFVQVLDAEASPSAPLPPALEHQPVIDFTCDREGLFGWNPEELQSVATFDLVHPADRTRAAAVFQTVVLQPAVYKIVEEALTNVMRHASARSGTISLEHGGGTLSVVIADDGAGFEPEQRGVGVGTLPSEGRR
jgi:hypothetical protein